EDNYAYGNDTASYKISKAGLDQQVYAYAKLQGVANEKVTLQIWEQADKQKVIQTIKEVQVNGKGVLKHPVALDTLEPLQDGNRLAFRIFNTAGKSIHKVSNTYSRKLGIYDDKKLLRAYYTDASGTILTKFMQYGQQVTLEVVTLNMVGKELEVELYQLIDWSLTDWNGDTKAIAGTKQKIKINSNGKAELQFTIDECWELQYAKEDKGYLEIIPKVNDNFYGGLSVRDTNYIYRLKVSPEAEKLNVEKSPQSCNLVKVEKTPNSNRKKNKKCIRCQTDLITLDLEKVVDAQKGDLPLGSAYGKRIFDYLPDLNKYMKEFGINDNCLRRGHFLGQVAKETGFWSYNEDFIYSASGLKETFGNFKTTEGKQKADDWGKTSSKKAEEVKIANWAYAKGSKASDLGNTEITDENWGDENGDGYKYRGRGLVQLTGKSNYKAFQKWYDKRKGKYSWPDYDFETNPEKVTEDSLIVALSAIYFWDKNHFNNKADMGEEEKDVRRISNVINSGEDDAKKTQRYQNVVAAINQVREKSDCAIINYTPPTNAGYYVFKNGEIKFIEGGKEVNYYVETEEGSNTFKKVATLTKNGYGLVKFPETGDGFGSYSNGDPGGIDPNARKRKSGNTIYTTTEHQGKGDRYLLPKTAACLFGMASELGILGYTVDFGDMSSENGSDPGKPGSHHSGHGHLGKRIGLDVDFRYVNSNKKSVQGKFTGSWFDFDKNKKIFEVAKKYNFIVNYSTKTTLIDLTVVSGTRHAAKHDDHGHLGIKNTYKPSKQDTISVNVIE
ncbi:glycoside hydrolase family 19 protein, partial [Aquimarina muelleri]